MQARFCDALNTLLARESLEFAAAIPFSACRVLRADKLRYAGLDAKEAKSVLILLVPYYVDDEIDSPISRYAMSQDYHLYFDALFQRVCGELRFAFPEHCFCAFADNSPIDERHAACLGGLGVLGDNGLLLNETYGSYVFIGEIISDLAWEDWYEGAPEHEVHEIKGCIHCGSCRRACPMEGVGGNPFGISECLSAVSQKKRLQSEAEENYIRTYRAGWGCDRCQEVCPYNRAPKETPIAFFKEARMPAPTSAQIAALSDGEFSKRAFAWRGRETVLRNLRLLEEKSDV